MFAYCLYCQTQKCKKISVWLEQKPEVNTAFSPQILKRQRDQQGKQGLIKGLVLCEKRRFALCIQYPNLPILQEAV